LEQVIVADAHGEKEVRLQQEKRDDNGALIHIVVFGETAGRRFQADQHGLTDDETVAGAPRRFTVKNLASGHPLDLSGKLIKGHKKKKKRTEPAGSKTA
jgi:hypothetical protein